MSNHIIPITPMSPIRAARDARSYFTAMPRPLPDDEPIAFVCFGVPQRFYTPADVTDVWAGHVLSVCDHVDCDEPLLVRAPVAREAVIALYLTEGHEDNSIYTLCASHGAEDVRHLLTFDEECAVVGDAAMRDIVKDMSVWRFYNSLETTRTQASTLADFPMDDLFAGKPEGLKYVLREGES